MTRWMIHAKRGDFEGIGRQFDVDPVIARILMNRGVKDREEIADFLHPSLSTLHDAALLKDGKRAARLLAGAMESGQKIRIIGDYDIDGIQSTYILKKGLQRCGALVDYAIPRRVEDGYGVNPSMIAAAEREGVSVIVTCDNGIAAADALTAAKKAGMTVIVTDHHEVPYAGEGDNLTYRLPPADAIVNPRQPDCAYPFPKLCGAAVAWKVVQLLYDVMGIDGGEAYDFLENVAFATVGDVMELIGENRALVTLGLEQLRRTRNPGMQALIGQCGIDSKEINAYHIGFVLGPCLNATGRLDTAVKAMELLEAANQMAAAAHARDLKNLNEERKAQTVIGVADAETAIAQQRMEEDKVLVVYLPALHESLAGIVAGRIRERYHRPTFVLTDAAEGVKGSGRSIEGYHMYRELCRCGDLFTSFGGHPMAAGISLSRDLLEELRRRLNENMSMSWEEMEPKRMIDVPMPISYLTPGLIRQLEQLEPFGNGNPKPAFAQKNVLLRHGRPIGKDGRYMKFLATADGVSVETLFFGDCGGLRASVEEAYPGKGWARMTDNGGGGTAFSIAYYPQLNRYRGVETMQIVITDWMLG